MLSFSESGRIIENEVWKPSKCRWIEENSRWNLQNKLKWLIKTINEEELFEIKPEKL